MEFIALKMEKNGLRWRRQESSWGNKQELKVPSNSEISDNHHIISKIKFSAKTSWNLKREHALWKNPLVVPLEKSVQTKRKSRIAHPTSDSRTTPEKHTNYVKS